ncbi:MAG TPA: hypothetical protein VMC82_01400 [Thermoplasmata archaeon]|nr:hypothetical protein [Thermoplasmata archaeon]
MPSARIPTTTTESASTRIASPISTSVSASVTHRAGRVRARSTIDTGTRSGPTTVAQMVETDSEGAAETESPARSSSRRIRSSASLSGSPEPTSSRRWAGIRSRRRVERGPSETTSATSTNVAGTCWKGWVHRHS